MEDRLPIGVGLFLGEKTRNYVHKSSAKFPIGKTLKSISIKALETVFAKVNEVETVEPFPADVPGVLEIKLLAFHTERRGLAQDAYIVLEAELRDEEGNRIWRDLILGEGTSGALWGDSAESVEASIQDSMLKLIYGIRESDEIKEFAAREFVSQPDTL